MTLKYKKVLLICPSFDNEHKNFQKFFEFKNIPIETILYNESDFLKKYSFDRFIFIRIIKNIIFLILRNIFSYELYKNLAFKRNEFNDFLVKESKNLIDKETLVFFIKPFLLNNSSFLKITKKKTQLIIFYHFDSVKRFPISKYISSKNIITFDLNDSVKHSYAYAPIPRNNYYSISETSRNSVYFYGAFSFYRLIHILIAAFIFKKDRVKFQFYLMMPKLNGNLKIFNIYLGPQIRRIKTNYIPIDIPQAKQSGGSFRSKNNSDLIFSYSFFTPYWRFIELRNVFSFYESIKKISYVLKAKNTHCFYLEEKNNSYQALDLSIENTLSLNKSNSD